MPAHSIYRKDYTMTNKELSLAYAKLGEAYKQFEGKSSPSIREIKDIILSAQSKINTLNMQHEYSKLNMKG